MSGLENQRGVTVYHIPVKIVDQNNAAVFLDPAKEIVASGKALVLDLSAIQFLNSAGLGALVALARDAELKGSGIRLSAPQAQVRALFKMVHIENIVKVEESVEAAVGSLALPGA